MREPERQRLPLRWRGGGLWGRSSQGRSTRATRRRHTIRGLPGKDPNHFMPKYDAKLSPTMRRALPVCFSFRGFVVRGFVVRVELFAFRLDLTSLHSPSCPITPFAAAQPRSCRPSLRSRRSAVCRRRRAVGAHSRAMTRGRVIEPTALI